MALAHYAGQMVAAAAMTDVWESARGRFARLLGRPDERKTRAAEQRLEQTRQQLAAAAPGATLERAVNTAAQVWATRFEDLLDNDPDARAELLALVMELTAELPAAVVPAVNRMAAWPDVNVAVSGGLAAALLWGECSSLA
jgi:hypothetical protein